METCRSTMRQKRNKHHITPFLRSMSTVAKDVAGLSGESGKDWGWQSSQGRGVLSIKVIYKLLWVNKMNGGFPAIVARVITFPFDKILILVAIFVTVKDLFHSIFKVIVNGDRLWWLRYVAINLIAFPGGEMVNMKNWVLMHRRWKA